MRGYQTSLRKTSEIVESSADNWKGFISTVAFTRLKKNSIAGLYVFRDAPPPLAQSAKSRSPACS